MFSSHPITMNTRFLLPLAAAFLFSCSQPAPVPDIVSNIERTVEEVAISSGVPVTMADLSIEGMSCEMMCGGSIKKALAQLPGVAGTEITFIEGEERDHAVVTYDESKVSDADMVAAIQKLHDGQYKVLAVKITKQVKSGSTTTDADKAEESNKAVSVLAPAVNVLPGILALLSHALRL